MTDSRLKIGVIIPARDEEQTVGIIARRVQAQATHYCDWRIIVADNQSGDETANLAHAAGAEVVAAAPTGYGAACLAGIHLLADWPDVLVFLDADGSSRPEEICVLLEPLARDPKLDLVLGVRPTNAVMTPPQKWGTRLAVILTWLFFRRRFQDMGPFRAIRRRSLEAIEMRDLTWGWTIEMQILAVLSDLKIKEVPVSWESRIAGVSKISGTVGGVLRAGSRILWTIGKYAWIQHRYRRLGTGHKTPQSQR